MNTLYHKNYTMFIYPATVFFSPPWEKDGTFIRNTDEVTRRHKEENHPALAGIRADDGEVLNSKICLSYTECPLYSV